jgi:glycosyltransferase involved in cell wall biosynthesis
VGRCAKLISVIVPAYNAEKFLERSLCSILSQSYTCLEVIVVDDGSTDTTYDIAVQKAADDARVKVFRKPNGGLSDARNYGLDKACGEYITFVDADDYLTENALSLMLSALQAGNLDFVVGGYTQETKSGNGRLLTVTPSEKAGEVFSGIDFFYHFYKQNEFIITAPAKLYCRSFLENTGIRFPKGFFHEDLLWTPCVFFAANRVAFISDNIYFYSFNIASITHSSRTALLIRDRIRIYHLLKERITLLENTAYRDYFIRIFAKDYLYFSSVPAFAFSEYSREIQKDYVRGKLKSPVLRFRSFIYCISPKLSSILQTICVKVYYFFTRKEL